MSPLLDRGSEPEDDLNLDPEPDLAPDADDEGEGLSRGSEERVEGRSGSGNRSRSGS